jgi:hypothetical protein
VFLSDSSELIITARPTTNAAAARLNVRKTVDSFGAQELSDFRRAVKQALVLNDKRDSIISLAGTARRSAGASITTRFSWRGTGLTCTG